MAYELGRITGATKFVEDNLASNRFSAGIVPPSDIVDIVNQMSGSTKVEALPLDGPDRQRLQAAYEAIANEMNRLKKTDDSPVRLATADNLHEFSIPPGVISRAQLMQQSRQLAAQRSMSMALGVADEELPGFDPTQLSTGRYGRMNSKAIIEGIKEAQIKEYEFQIQRMNASGISGLDVGRVQQSLNNLRSADEATLRRLFAMGTGKISEQFASFSASAELGESAKGMMGAAAIRTPKSLLEQLQPVSAPKYTANVRSFLQSEPMRKIFEEYAALDLDVGRLPNVITDFQIGEVAGDISINISRGISAIKEIHSGSGANVLDIVDTFESEMQKLYGNMHTARFSGAGDEGAESTMSSLHELAVRRRHNRANTFDREAFELLQESFGMSFNGKSLLGMSSEDAQSLLDASRESESTLGGKLFDKDVEDYLRLVSQSDSDSLTGLGGTKAMTESSRLARELFKQKQMQEEGMRIIEETDELVGRSSPVAASFDADDARRLASEIDSASSGLSTEVPALPGSPYRRMSDMLRDSESSLRKIVDSRGFRGFAIGATALIAGSFIYQSKKNKDITQESIGGPPLMPGGNPYEQNYPELSTAKQDFRFNNPGSSGMQFRVNTSGSMQDLNKLRGLFGDVVDGPMDATMYNGLPMAGQDPYSDLASRF